MLTICAWCRFTIAAPRRRGGEPVVNYGMCPACRDDELGRAAGDGTHAGEPRERGRATVQLDLDPRVGPQVAPGRRARPVASDSAVDPVAPPALRPCDKG